MSEVFEKETLKKAVKPPSSWNVILHNDDFTSFDMVIYLLVSVFNKSVDEAASIAQLVHQKGKGIAGKYQNKDLAETKQTIAMDFAKSQDMPLMITLEMAE